MAAIPYICEGDCISLDTGSTSFELAALLCEHFHELTVVTNSLQVFQILSGKEGFQTCLLYTSQIILSQQKNKDRRDQRHHRCGKCKARLRQPDFGQI